MQRLFFISNPPLLLTPVCLSPISPRPVHLEAYAVYFYAFPSDFPDFPEIESLAR